MGVEYEIPRDTARVFAEWYDEHFEYVWRTLRRLGVHPAELGDLTHDVFFVAWEQRATVDGDRPMRPWLFGVAFRVASSHLRRHWFRRRSSEPVVEVQDERQLNPERRAVLLSELQLVQRALDRLSLKHRAVLLLHDFDEVPLADVAVALDLPVKTAYSRLAAARKSFRQVYRQLQLASLPAELAGQPQPGEIS